jgi:hypothetical protein
MTLEIMQPETSQYNESVHTVCCSRSQSIPLQYASYNIIVPVTSTVGQGPGYVTHLFPVKKLNAEPALLPATNPLTVGRGVAPLKF